MEGRTGTRDLHTAWLMVESSSTSALGNSALWPSPQGLIYTQTVTTPAGPQQMEGEPRLRAASWDVNIWKGDPMSAG